MVSIIQDFIAKGRKNRPGLATPMLYITIHNTGNTSKGSGAKNHANYIKSDGAANALVSWHYTVDDSCIYQHLPDSETAYHAGDGSGNGNKKSIGIEICMNSDGNILNATNNAVELTAKLCKDHNIPIGNIKQHCNWTGKNCPQLIRAGNPYNWDTFIAKVKTILVGTPTPAPTPVPSTSYLVRVTATSLNVRKGAGTNFAIAGAIKDKGTYTIVAESSGAGATKWGKLKSGAGWISLDYCKRV